MWCVTLGTNHLAFSICSKSHGPRQPSLCGRKQQMDKLPSRKFPEYLNHSSFKHWNPTICQDLLWVTAHHSTQSQSSSCLFLTTQNASLKSCYHRELSAGHQGVHSACKEYGNWGYFYPPPHTPFFCRTTSFALGKSGLSCKEVYGLHPSHI